MEPLCQELRSILSIISSFIDPRKKSVHSTEPA